MAFVPSRLRWYWWLTLTAVVFGVWWWAMASEPQNDARSALIVSILAVLPWSNAIPTVYENALHRRRSTRVLLVAASWLLLPVIPAFAGAVAASLGRRSEAFGLPWLAGAIVGVVTSVAIAGRQRSARARLLLIRVSGAVVVAALLVWFMVQPLTIDALFCLDGDLIEWRPRLLLFLAMLLVASLLDYRRRTGTVQQARYRIGVLACLTVAAAALIPPWRSGEVPPERVLRIWRAQLTTRGDLVMAVSLDGEGPCGHTVLFRPGKQTMRRLSRRCDVWSQLSVAPDGSRAAFSECPQAWRALTCGSFYGPITGIVNICPYLTTRIVDLADGATVHSSVSSPIDNWSLRPPALGPDGAWAMGPRVELTGGRVVAAPAGGDEIVAEWFSAEVLHVLSQAQGSGGGCRALRLTSIDVRSASSRKVDLSVTSCLHRPHVAPDGAAVVVSDGDYPESHWWLIDDQGHVETLPNPVAGDEPLLVWRRDGHPELCAVESNERVWTYEDAMEFASGVYLPSSSRCSEGAGCHVTLAGVRRRVRSLDAHSVQWLGDSAILVVAGQRVVRFWPDRDKSETLFSAASIRR